MVLCYSAANYSFKLSQFPLRAGRAARYCRLSIVAIIIGFLGTTSGQLIKFSHIAEKESIGQMAEPDIKMVGQRKSCLRPGSVKEALRNSPILSPPGKALKIDVSDSPALAPPSLAAALALPGGFPSGGTSSPDVLADSPAATVEAGAGSTPLGVASAAAAAATDVSAAAPLLGVVGVAGVSREGVPPPGLPASWGSRAGLSEAVVSEGLPSFAPVGSSSLSAHVPVAFGEFAGKGDTGQNGKGGKFAAGSCDDSSFPSTGGAGDLQGGVPQGQVGGAADAGVFNMQAILAAIHTVITNVDSRFITLQGQFQIRSVRFSLLCLP